MNVALSIESYSLKNAGVWLEGQAAVHVDAQTDVERGYGDPSFDILLATLHLPGITFMTGPVPFHIQTTIPIHAGGDLYLISKAGGTVRSFAALDGDVKYGVQYTPASGFQYINTHSFSHSGGLHGSHMEMTATARVYIMPVVVLEIDYIGGPAVGFKGFLQSSVDYQEEWSMCSPTGGAGASYTVAWGLQVTLSAQLHIAFAGHTFLRRSTDAGVIWSHQWPVASGCLSSTNTTAHAHKRDQRLLDYTDVEKSNPMHVPRSATQYDFFEGVQYVGPITIDSSNPSCAQLVSIHGGLQFVNQSEQTTFILL